jgi:hypothetical protein
LDGGTSKIERPETCLANRDKATSYLVRFASKLEMRVSERGFLEKFYDTACRLDGLQHNVRTYSRFAVSSW